MIRLRPAALRGHFDHGWLDTWHSFSFGDYFDPENMGFRSLRVINDDVVAPDTGFGPHPHRDMEIVTWVLDGALEHGDNMGNSSVIRPGEVQRMSAGTGVVHSERNPSPTEPVHLLQIWILPEKARITPSYEQKVVPREERRGRLRLVASRDGAEGSVTIHQDARLYATILEPGEEVVHRPADGRHAWIQVARGSVALNGTALVEGDGAAVSGEAELRISATTPAELLLFDLA